MSELFATTKCGFGFDARNIAATSAPYTERRRGDVCLMVAGPDYSGVDCFENHGIVLICRTDLLGWKKFRVGEELARLYSQKGDDFAADLRGAFAIILYEDSTRTLKAWTDQFGVERLAFTASGNALSVSTDLRLLVAAASNPPDLDPTAIPEYLQYTCIPTPRTIYKGFSKLPPGHQLISGPTPRTRCYWDVVYAEKPRRSRGESEWAAAARDAIRAAVERNVSDIDDLLSLGCFLSGGTDSSTITGLVGRITKRPPRAFSIGFDDPRYNEMQYARVAARQFHSDHHEYFVTPADIIDVVQKAQLAYDEPFGNSSIVPTYYCARLAAHNGVSLLLAGDGGDELFGGNARYVHDRVFQHYGRIPVWFRRSLLEPAVTAASRIGLGPFRKAVNYTRRSNIPAPDRYFSYSLISSVAGTELFAGDFLEAAGRHDTLIPARNHFKTARAANDLNRWLYMDMKITIADNDLRKVTTMSRLAGASPRYPFLDPSLAEFAGTIPADLKVRKNQLRYLFKKAMADLLPQEIITKTKHGFGLPYAVWLAEHKPLRDFTFDVLGSARCRQRGYFRPNLLEWLWPQYEAVHRAFYGEIFWLLLMLELWHVAQWDETPAKTHYASNASL